MTWTINDKNTVTQRWEDPDQTGAVEFLATLVAPEGTCISNPEEKKYPLAVYFPGLDEKPNEVITQMAGAWAKIAPEPLLMVAAHKPMGMWWFIDGGRAWGWVEGSFRQDLVARLCRWLSFLADRPFVDKGRIGVFGFSAGAYAVAEILSHGCIPLTGAGIAGIHGHGQLDTSDLPKAKAQGVTAKYAAFLDRVKQHVGVPWFEATHGITDQVSKWSEAEPIIRCLSERQLRLGLPAVSVRQLEAAEQDQKPSKKRNRCHHNYFQAAFYRREFLVALLGGPRPEPQTPKVVKREISKFEWESGYGNWSWYSKRDHDEIVKCFTMLGGRGRAEVNVEGLAYTFDFDSMHQIDIRSGRKWRIRHWTETEEPGAVAESQDLIENACPKPLPLDACKKPVPLIRLGQGGADVAGHAWIPGESQDPLVLTPSAQNGLSRDGSGQSVSPASQAPLVLTPSTQNGLSADATGQGLSRSQACRGGRSRSPRMKSVDGKQSLDATSAPANGMQRPLLTGHTFDAASAARNGIHLPPARLEAASGGTNGIQMSSSGGQGEPPAHCLNTASAVANGIQVAPASAAAPGMCFGTSRWPGSFVVQGCLQLRLGPWLNGTYSLCAENHVRPVYRKIDGSEIMLYFWDGRDGPENHGWWFGLRVGSDSVMAFNADIGELPPAAGWKCLEDGTFDPTLVIRACP